MHPKFTPEFVEKFWQRVDRSGGPDACWPWLAGLSPKGYGIVSHKGVEEAFGAKSARAHRVAFVLSGGVIPDGHRVCHTCDIRHCCNFSHHFAATQLENIKDRDRKGRQDHGPNAPRFKPLPKRGIRKGEFAPRAKLTEDQVREIRAAYIPGKRGFGITSLAKKYGVHDFAIEMIVKRKSWKHVA